MPTVLIRFSFTPLSPAGRAFVAENHSEPAFRAEMAFWGASMNHWLRTGETLSAAAC